MKTVTLLGYTFKDASHYQKCFVTYSYGTEHNVESYRRYEFLGDRLLKSIQGEYLFNRYTLDTSGGLSEKQQMIESNTFLAMLFEVWKLDASKILFGSISKREVGMRIKSRIVEAILASIYIDSGYTYNTLKQWCIQNMYPTMDAYIRDMVVEKKCYNPIGKLNEFFQREQIKPCIECYNNDDKKTVVIMRFHYKGTDYSFEAIDQNLKLAKINVSEQILNAFNMFK